MNTDTQINNKVTIKTENKSYSFSNYLLYDADVADLKIFAQAFNSLQKEPAVKIFRTRDFVVENNA